MASSLHQWESDPLFSAAEVVQDSADRMESIFRLLLHEQDLVQGDHPEPRMLTSIAYHKRDLATILETAKWQLEDFERAVSSLSVADKSQTREDVILRHRQFIRAIKDQIHNVEKSVEGPTIGDSMRNSEWVNLNEQDREVLASFLAGGNLADHFKCLEKEDSSMLRRFLDPTSSSGLNDDEIIEDGSKEFEKVRVNGNAHIDHYIRNIKENNLRKVGSHHTLGFDSTNSVQERPGGNDHWDLEANETAQRNPFHENRLRAFFGRINSVGFLSNLWYTSGSRVTRNYTKRLKDGEEQGYSPTYADASHSAKGQHKGVRWGPGYRGFQVLCSSFLANIMHFGNRLMTRDQRFPCRVQVNQRSMQMVLTAVIMLIFFGVLLFRII